MQLNYLLQILVGNKQLELVWLLYGLSPRLDVYFASLVRSFVRSNSLQAVVCLTIIRKKLEASLSVCVCALAGV